MLDGILWFFKNLAFAFYNLGYAVTHPGLWLDWSNKESLVRFIYYGGSVQFFFVMLLLFALLTIAGFLWRPVMWRSVRIIEGFGNTVGRFVAWAGLIMVLQQVMIIFLQRIFRVSEISFGPFAPFGYELWDKFTLVSFDLSWWSEELKLYNAMVVTLACAYTFIQGGHVRVDLVYSGVSYSKKKLIDMCGSLFLMMPSLILTWLYAWYFLWRHLVTPKVSATDKLELMLKKATILRWNVETIGFSPNGFNGYFLFKVLLVSFVAMMLLQAVGFFYRSFLEYVEGPESEGKYLDKDTLGEGEEAFEGTH
ncbi:MAG: C4-dicarboxylate ABC transporter permease [Paracoccaceae bacterium]